MKYKTDSRPGFRPRAVLFDMDGLMLDTERPVIGYWIQAGRVLGYEIPREIIYRTIGINDRNSRILFQSEYGPDFPYDDYRREAVRLIHEAAAKQGIPHRPGLLPLLDHLGGLKLPLAVATSTDRETAVWKLTRAGIQDRFAALACGDEVRRGKPAPDIFLLAAQRLGKAPAECIGFEDSPAGLRSLHTAGIPSVFIKDILEPPEDVLAGVWQRYQRLDEAIELFR
jgi:HAD superfamily hydrolase (TIGR01509 family)